MKVLDQFVAVCFALPYVDAWLRAIRVIS